MTEEILYNNEYLKIYQSPDGFYIETFKKGFSLEELNHFLYTHSEINITSFNTLKNALSLAPKPPERFGEPKKRFLITLSEDELKAFVEYNLSPEELDIKNRETVIKETISLLNDKGIIFGVKNDLFYGELSNGKKYVIAEGVPPINGVDSVIHLYTLKEAKPELIESGKADFYELKLINMVNEGDWLGERIEATMGVPGQSVKGIPIKAIQGKNYPLPYDKNSVKEEFTGDKTVLLSRFNGAVNYNNDKIAVSNHLEIDGDVDFKTGNIKFDGYLTIQGTIADGFSVEATKDIEINSVLGVGNVKEIISKEGSIFIRGGIASKGKSEIQAARNVFTKFIDNASVHCNGTAHIGFSCINSIVKAREVIIESAKGQILGGTITAQIKVTAPVVGCAVEKRTVINITGFDRVTLNDEFIDISHKIEELKKEQQKLKGLLSNLQELGHIPHTSSAEYDTAYANLIQTKDKVKLLEADRKNLAVFLRAKGEGELNVAKKVFPNCIITIKGIPIHFTSSQSTFSFYFQDGQIRQV